MDANGDGVISMYVQSSRAYGVPSHQQLHMLARRNEFQASLDVYPIILNCFAGCALPGLVCIVTAVQLHGGALLLTPPSPQEPIRKPLRSCIDKPSSYLVDDSRWSIDYLHEVRCNGCGT